MMILDAQAGRITGDTYEGQNLSTVQEKHSSLSFAVALWVASSSIDLAIATQSGRGWLPLDLVTLFALSCVATIPFVFPWLLVRAKLGDRMEGLMFAGVVLMQVAVGLRFGPLINAPLSSAPVLGSMLGIFVVLLGFGWFLGPKISAMGAPKTRALWVISAIACAVAFFRLGTVGSHPIDATEGPNIIIFTWDTTRADHLSVYGHDIKTPNLEALAQKGVVFETAVTAAPQTGPAHLSILSGRYPISHGVVANGTNIGDQPAMLARTFEAAGYQTSGFVAAFPIHERFSFGQGFDVFDSDFSPIVGLHELAAIRAYDAVIFRNLPRERRGGLVNERAIRWLSHLDDADAPIFSWVHYYDPHGPYTPPDAFHEIYTGPPKEGGKHLDLPHFWSAEQRAITDTDYLTAQYDAEITYTDYLFGEVMKVMDSKSRDTIVVVTADHGESLTEHGVLFDHGDDLYDPSMLVPLIIRAPEARPGLRVKCQTPTVDIAPTLLDLAGLDDGIDRDGVSRVSEMMGARCDDHDAFSSTVSERIPNPPVDHALRRANTKFIDKAVKEDELYNLQVDPDELRNLNTLEPALSGAMSAVLSARQKGGTAPIEAEMSDDVINMLKELGYIDDEGEQ